MQKTHIGLRMQQRLDQMDHDQKWLAGVLRVSQPTISRWMDGTRRMSTRDLERIALALHRAPGWFMEGQAEAIEDDLVSA